MFDGFVVAVAIVFLGPAQLFPAAHASEIFTPSAITGLFIGVIFIVPVVVARDRVASAGGEGSSNVWLFIFIVIIFYRVECSIEREKKQIDQ